MDLEEWLDFVNNVFWLVLVVALILATLLGFVLGTGISMLIGVLL